MPIENEQHVYSKIDADNLQTIGLSSLVNLGTFFELYKLRISILQH